MKMKMKIVTGKTQRVTQSNDVTWSFIELDFKTNQYSRKRHRQTV